MNIVQIHQKIAFFLDAEMSPRFKVKQVDKAIRSAISDIVLDRYQNIRESEKKYAFQTAQRLRDELGTIVKRTQSASISDDTVVLSGITDYWIVLSMKANISGDSINTIPLTYDEINIIDLDPFRRPSITEPKRIYRIESSEGIQVIFGDIGSLQGSDLYYLAEPVTVDIGTEVPIGEVLYSETVIAAYTESIIQFYNGDFHTIKEGESYMINALSEVTATLISGILFKDYTDTDLPVLLHEEICRKASSVLVGNVENFNKKKSLDEDIRNPQ